MKYKYGMRLRGYSIGCQPLKGLLDVTEDRTGKYYDILTYDRRLEQKELDGFELTFLGEIYE